MTHFDLPLDQLREFRPTVSEPADFDDFWQRTIADARAMGGGLLVGTVEHQLPHVEISDVTFPGYGGQPIKAWYARPAGDDSRLPVIVQYAGYGGGRGLAIEHTFWAAAGFAHLVMDTRGQGSAWGNGGVTPDPEGSGPALPGYMTRGILDPEQYYYRRVYTDAVRAVDAARALPGVDPARVVIHGGSQGGGITLAVAGLVGDLAAVMPDVPFLCGFERATSITDKDPYGEIRRYLAVHRDLIEPAFATLSYHDGINFAARANAPTIFSVGLMDEICPPSTVFAAFNRYGERAGDVRKQIEVYPFNGHEGGQGHQAQRQWAFLRDVLGL